MSTMGRAVATKKRVKALLLTTILVNITVLILYLYIMLTPYVYFTGLIQGYAGLAGYKVAYIATGAEVKLPHSDTVRLVSYAVLAVFAGLLVSTFISLVSWFKEVRDVSAGIAFGVSTALVVSSGVLNYLNQAFRLDAERLARFNGVIVSKTLAGTLRLIGVNAEWSAFHTLMFNTRLILSTPLILLIPALTLILSATSLMLTAYTYGESMNPLVENTETARSMFKLGVIKHSLTIFSTSIIPILLLLINACGAVFVYGPFQASIIPTSPPVIFSQPPLSYCIGLARASRGAVLYTDFETYPLPGWSSLGGTWTSTTAGYKGNALQGVDNNRGLGGESQNVTTVPLYTSLWVSVKTRWVSGSGWYGIALLNSDINRMYVVEIATSGYLVIYSYNVERRGWYIMNYTEILNYNIIHWYVIVVDYVVTASAVSIYASLYDVNDNQVAYTHAVSTATTRFTPAYIGVSVDNVAAVFDDFIASTSDPRVINVQNVVVGHRVELWDNLGNLVTSTTATASTVLLSVVSDTVVGTGVDGRVVVRFSEGVPCLVYTSPDSLLGGDTYLVNRGTLIWTTGANYTSIIVSAGISSSPVNTSGLIASYVSNGDSKPYYARLLLVNYTGSLTLTANITLYNSTHISQPIRIVSGAPTNMFTDWVLIPAGSSGGVSFTGYFTSSGQTGTIRLLLQYCTLPNEGGACVYYPVEINVSS